MGRRAHESCRPSSARRCRSPGGSSRLAWIASTSPSTRYSPRGKRWPVPCVIGIARRPRVHRCGGLRRSPGGEVGGHESEAVAHPSPFHPPLAHHHHALVPANNEPPATNPPCCPSKNPAGNYVAIFKGSGHTGGVKRDLDLEATIVEKYVAVAPVLDERSRRRWAAAESMAIGYAGDALVSSATGLARETIRRGRREIARGETPTGRIRAPGAGRPGIEEDQPGIMAALEALVDPLTRWEFEHINATADRLLRAGEPVISVDTKKKELVGNFANRGRGCQPKGTPEAVRVRDFPSDAEGKAIPHGVYDMARNEASVSVGRDYDTPAFAVASIRHWWRKMGRRAYPQATTLYITADSGSSNGYRSRAEQVEQDRAPALLPHHGELAQHPADDVRDHRGPHREHSDRRRAPGPGRTR